jgi:CheY-like chemotaxis protein
LLLVEDNPVNREVAINMLETLRCTVAVAVNGQQAVEKIKEQDFDLVLMDCEMPVMDGYETTEAIRKWESEKADSRRTPIVALTAHALAEDRQRCLAVGMDDYLTKPYTMDELRRRVGRWITSASIASQALPLHSAGENIALGESEHDNVIQFQTLESIVSLDPANGKSLLARLIDVYETNSMELIDAIRDSLEEGNMVDLGKAAHALKSSSGNVGANRLLAMCREIELRAKNSHVSLVPKSIEALLCEHRKVLAELRQWQKRRSA